MTKTFNQLIAEAQAALDAISAHPEFGTLVESGFWKPTINLHDARFALDDLKDTNNYVQAILEMDEAIDKEMERVGVDRA